MSRYKNILCLISLICLVIASGANSQQLNNPYEILNKYFEAAGGLDKFKNIQTSYIEGKLQLGGMQGDIKMWYERPGKNRAEADLGILKIIQGDNGSMSWTLDQNGKLQKVTNFDEVQIKRRQVQELLDDYAYADPKSDVFTVAYEGIDTANGQNCYVLKITNNINSDSYTRFIDTANFQEEKAVYIEGDQSRDVYYSDYHQVDGVLIPFHHKRISHITGRPQDMTFSEYQINPEIDEQLFESPGEGKKDYRFLSGHSAENIPFRLIENHLFIPVIVNGKESLWILDTGAGKSAITRSLAEQLGLKLEGELTARGAGGNVQTAFAHFPSFRIDSIEFDEQTVAVIDMSQLLRRIGVDFVGILGFDFLSRFVTRIDYANELISFYDPETFSYTGSGHVMDMHIINNVFTIPAQLEGIHNGSWLFDIGAGTASLHGAYALREGYTDKPGLITVGHGAGNEFQIKKIRCQSLELAGFKIDQPAISFSYGGQDTTSVSDQLGALGNNIFRNFVIYVDYAHEHLILEKGKEFNQFQSVDHSGLVLAWDDEKRIEIVYVPDNSPADKAGFKKGDTIVSINGLDISAIDGVLAVRKLLKAEPGTEYEFIVNRDGQQKKLKLKLKKLY